MTLFGNEKFDHGSWSFSPTLWSRLIACIYFKLKACIEVLLVVVLLLSASLLVAHHRDKKAKSPLEMPCFCFVMLCLRCLVLFCGVVWVG